MAEEPHNHTSREIVISGEGATLIMELTDEPLDAYQELWDMIFNNKEIWSPAATPSDDVA